MIKKRTKNGDNELERTYMYVIEKKRTKPNSKYVCVHVLVKLGMERLKTQQIV